MLIRVIRIVLFVSGVFLVSGSTGCSSNAVNQGKKLSSVRTPDPSRKPIEMQVSRPALRKAIADSGSLNRARLVEVFFREQELGGSPPEYRIFDITPGSAYEILGLKNADVLVAAEDYIVPSAAVFRSYIGMLANQREGSIEIRRMGQPMLLHYTLVD